MLQTFLFVFILGTTLLPHPVIAMGFGPVSPSKPPPSLSPFAPQQPSPEQQQASQEILFSCICDQSYCGNTAISGRFGQIKKETPSTDLSKKYGPERTGDAATGWICLQQGHYRCECVDGTCGNGAVEAERATVFEVETVEKVIADFKPWKTGEQKTGWQCVLQEPTSK